MMNTPVAAYLPGAFVVWRMDAEPKTIREWGVYQLSKRGRIIGAAAVRRLFNWTPEVICESRVPVFASSNPRAILAEDIEKSKKALIDELVRQVRERADLASLRDEFRRIERARQQVA